LKLNWPLLVCAIVSGGALANVGLLFVTNIKGVWPTVADMQLAAELGAAIGGTLTFTAPFRLLKR
jgi:hypothetical protein